MTEPFDQIMERLDTPMAVVTTAHDGERSGCLVGFSTQCSIGPRRFAVWLSKANHTFGLAVRAERFAVHWLAEGDGDLAAHFGALTGDETDKFAGLDWVDAGAGLPVLPQVADRMVAARHALFDDGSDHVCLVLDPLEVVAGGGLRPLRLSSVSDLEPGHPADDF